MSLFTETWTAANGAAWNSANWTTTTPATATTDVQSNKGRQVSATTPGTGPSAKFLGSSTITDFEATWSAEFLTAATSYSVFSFHGDTFIANRGAVTNGYLLLFTGGPSLAFYGMVGGSASLLTSAVPSVSGAVFRFRLLVANSNATCTMKAKAWTDANAEPDAWTISTSDATYLSGIVGIGVESTAAAAEGMGWDDLVITYPPAPSSSPARRYYSLA